MQVSSPQKNENFFVVYAHSEQSSFCSLLNSKTLTVLNRHMKQVMESDLYAMNFNPCISSKDFQHLSSKPTSNISVELEQKKSSDLNTLAPDIIAELDKLMKADYIIFICPMYFGSVPAILKGWFDRVLVRGRAWDVNKWHENGLLKGKKAILVITVASKKVDFTYGGFHNNTIENMLHPITWTTLRFCGLEVETYVIYEAGAKNKEYMEGEVLKYEEYIEGFFKN